MGFEGSFLPSVCAWQVRKHLTAAGPCMRGITPNSDVFKQSWEGEFAIPCDTVDFSFFRKKPVKRFECFLLNSYQNFMISVLKENAVATFVESIQFDQNDEINTGIESYSVYQNKKAKFHVVEYRDPETGQLHAFISTLPKSINPGTIAMLYYKRWTIEKAFNNSKSDFTERKAWSSNLNALNSQMRFTAMAYNIMRIFEEISKAKNPERIHPSDKKYNEALDKREKIAQEKGRFVNPLFFHARIARICSFTIRSLQNAIMTGKSLIAIMGSLARHLKPRMTEIAEH